MTAYERDDHRAEALNQLGMAERSDLEYQLLYSLGAIAHAVLALSAPDLPDSRAARDARALDAILGEMGRDGGPNLANVMRMIRDTGRAS